MRGENLGNRWGIRMRKVLVLAIALACAWLVHGYYETAPATAPAPEVAVSSNDVSNGQVSGTGTVIRILPDDDTGDRHQRFLLRLQSGATLLVAHNIDIAPRVEPL